MNLVAGLLNAISYQTFAFLSIILKPYMVAKDILEGFVISWPLSPTAGSAPKEMALLLCDQICNGSGIIVTGEDFVILQSMHGEENCRLV